jgi:hypothetical protein
MGLSSNPLRGADTVKGREPHDEAPGGCHHDARRVGVRLRRADAVPHDFSARPAEGAPQKKPNILVIFGDDIGMWNVGAYTHGMMGRTPSIDRIAAEGMRFTDHYGQPSCTAGRAAFITGQFPIRTGMTTIGIPGSTRGIQKSDPTLAEVLKSQGYATAQFGKNHLGDRNEFLPTVRAWLRGVVRKSVPPQRRGGAGGARLPGP